MPGRSRHFLRFLHVPLAALLVVGLSSAMPGFPGAPRKAKGTHKLLSQPTVDPEPPVAVSVEMVTLQKNSNGGVASLRFRANATVSMEGAVLSAKVPGNLVFSDGSSAKSWNVDLAAAGAQGVTADVIVPQDGKYVISAELTGTAKGTPIHRGVAYKLLVGVQEPTPKIKDGAIEYAGSPGGGV